MYFFTCLCSFFVFAVSQEGAIAEPLQGGHPASGNEYSFAVSVRREGTPRCTGVLLSDRWVLTAAHCLVQDYETKTLHDHTKCTINVDKLLRTDYPAAKFEVHSDYFKDFFQYDIGLIKVQGSIDYNKYVGPIKIADASTLQSLRKTGKSVKIASLGFTHAHDHALPRRRQILEAKVMSSQECVDTYHMREPNGPDNLFCTVSPHDKGTTLGDSGAPVVATQFFGKKYLIGIHTRNAHARDNEILPETCCDGRPAFHLKIDVFRTWIYEKIIGSN